MRLCKNCMVARITATTGTYTVRRLTFSDGFHSCECLVEPALYFVMKLERIEAKEIF